MNPGTPPSPNLGRGGASGVALPGGRGDSEPPIFGVWSQSRLHGDTLPNNTPPYSKPSASLRSHLTVFMVATVSDSLVMFCFFRFIE